jgi:hypothetical protein
MRAALARNPRRLRTDDGADSLTTQGLTPLQFMSCPLDTLESSLVSTQKSRLAERSARRRARNHDHRRPGRRLLKSDACETCGVLVGSRGGDYAQVWQSTKLGRTEGVRRANTLRRRARPIIRCRHAASRVHLT